MRFEAIVREENTRKLNAQREDPLADDRTLAEVTPRKLVVIELIFEGSRCECNRMAAIPQGAFAVLQVRKNLERPHPAKLYDEEEESKGSKNNGFNAKVLQEGRELTPLKYNSKLMNSIWGLYNRYSVHNFKKIDANDAGFLAWGFNDPTEATACKGPVYTAGH